VHRSAPSGREPAFGERTVEATIASLKMSAALPCTGAFCAIAQPICRIRKLSDEAPVTDAGARRASW